MTKTLTTFAVLASLAAGLAATPSMAAGYRDRGDSFNGQGRGAYDTPLERAYKAGKADGHREAHIQKRFERERGFHGRPWWARKSFGRWGYGYGYGHHDRRWW